MAEYYGNSPSRDYFSLVTALKAGFSDDKIGTPGDNNLFSLSSGFQQSERFPEQPQYQYRMSNAEPVGGTTQPVGGGDLIFQEIDCLACCDYPCPPIFSGFNPGSIELSFSDTGEWKSHDVEVSFSIPPSPEITDMSSLPSFGWTSEDWTEVGTNTGSWSWGDTGGGGGTDGGGGGGGGQSWSWWDSNWGNSEDESAIMTSGDFPPGGYPCYVCGGFNRDPANTRTESQNITKSFASSILVTAYWDLKYKVTKTHACKEDWVSITEGTLDQGHWDIWFCADASLEPANTGGTYTNSEGTWIQNEIGEGIPPGGVPDPEDTRGWPVVCFWRAEKDAEDGPETTFSLSDVIDDICPEGALEHYESFPVIDWLTNYCDNPTGEGLFPWGGEGVMEAPYTKKYYPMKCCGGLGKCGSCSEGIWCACDCSDYDSCECNPEDNDPTGGQPSDELCIDGCYVTGHPNWRDICNSANDPPTQEDYDDCTYSPGRWGGVFEVRPIPKKAPLVDDATLKILFPSVKGTAQLGSFFGPGGGYNPWGPINFELKIGVGLGVEVDGHEGSNINVQDPNHGYTVNFQVNGDVPADPEWACNDDQCAQYRNLNSENISGENFSPSLSIDADDLGGTGAFTWGYPSVNTYSNSARGCAGEPTDPATFCNCDGECDGIDSQGGICLGTPCLPAEPDWDCDESDPSLIDTKVDFWLEISEIDVEVHCGISSIGNCDPGLSQG